MSYCSALLATVATLVFVHAADAADPDVKCESSKLKEASKYGACRLKAKSNAVKKGLAPDYTKCDANFSTKWNRVESTAAGACPTSADESRIAGEITKHTEKVSEALAGVLPNVGDNIVGIEINSVGDFSMNSCGYVVIVRGLGFEIERIAGFDGFGEPDDSPGLTTATPFIFEYSGSCEGVLQAELGSGTPRDGSVIIRDLAVQEIDRFNMYGFEMTAIVQGTEGRNRYTLERIPPPVSFAPIQGGGLGGQSASSFNPATDKQVEIDGVLTNRFPAVEIGSLERTLVLTFEWQEAFGTIDWANTIANGLSSKTTMTVIDLDESMVETGRTYYTGVFPISYELLSGFSLPEKLRIRLVVSYDSAEPALPKTVFVSSTQTDGSIGGLAAADAICQSLADAAGLPGTYLAWLGDHVTQEAPANRFTHALGPYVRTDGVIVANDWDDLVDGTILAIIDHDENQNIVASEDIWTGTAGDGLAFVLTSNNCDRWTTNVGDDGVVGSTDETDSNWTYVGNAPCSEQHHLYCFEQ